jgi:peptide deformylase
MCVSVITDTMATYYYSDGIGIASVMTDTHITILMVLAFFSDDRCTYYYSDDIGIVSVMTDTYYYSTIPMPSE